jgi:hypothetical protein
MSQGRHFVRLTTGIPPKRVAAPLASQLAVPGSQTLNLQYEVISKSLY